jgi:hypothetical protein
MVQLEGGDKDKRTPSKVPKTHKNRDVTLVTEKLKGLKVVSVLTHLF